MATILPTGKQSFISNSGAPLSGGKLYTYAAGTSTPKRTYADAGATTPNANPIILDSRGEAAVFWSGAYKATPRRDATAVVEEGLKEGELIIVDGILKVRPGMVVNPSVQPSSAIPKS